MANDEAEGHMFAWTQLIPTACDATGTLVTTNPFQMFVKFSFIAVPDAQTSPANANPITAAPSLDDGPATSIFNFQSDGPSLPTCTGFNDAANVYFPGDGSINLQTTGPFSTFANGTAGDAPAIIRTTLIGACDKVLRMLSGSLAGSG